MSAEQKLIPPAIGEIWPGQGGIYAGIMPSRNGSEAYHLIIGEDIGRYEWGPYGEESPTTNLIDGLANTLSLVENDANFPAAIAAYEHKADGHNDFYLPAIAELNEAWMNLGDKQWGWLWSSSQRSAHTAFVMFFNDGSPDHFGKDDEWRVRPVRRLPIQ